MIDETSSKRFTLRPRPAKLAGVKEIDHENLNGTTLTYRNTPSEGTSETTGEAETKLPLMCDPQLSGIVVWTLLH